MKTRRGRTRVVGPPRRNQGKNWHTCTLSSIGKIVGGGTPDTKDPHYWNGGIPWATPTDVTSLKSNFISTTKRSITKAGLSNSAARLLPKHSILITTRATIGEVAINAVPMATNQGFHSLCCNPEIDFVFVFYLIQYHKPKFSRYADGTTFLEIGKTDLDRIKVRMPPIREQRRIASILSNVDALMENTESIIDSCEKLRLGLTQNLFLDGNVNASSSQTWGQATLSSIAHIDPRLPRNSRPDPLTSVSYVPMSSIEENTGRIALEFTKKFKNTRGYTYFQNNDVLFAKITPSMENGKIAIAKNLVNGIGFATTEVYVIRLNALKYDPIFYLYYLLRPSFRACARRTMSGSAGQLRVPSSFIKNTKVPIPPISEQRRIASILSGVDAPLESHAPETKFLILIVFFNIGLKIPTLDNRSCPNCRNPEAGCALMSQ